MSIKTLTPCGFHSAPHLLFFLGYAKCADPLAAIALCPLEKSIGKSHDLLASANKAYLWIPGKKMGGPRDITVPTLGSPLYLLVAFILWSFLSFFVNEINNNH